MRRMPYSLEFGGKDLRQDNFKGRGGGNGLKQKIGPKLKVIPVIIRAVIMKIFSYC